MYVFFVFPSHILELFSIDERTNAVLGCGKEALDTYQLTIECWNCSFGREMARSCFFVEK
jgi:hypothetical protein